MPTFEFGQFNASIEGTTAKLVYKVGPQAQSKPHGATVTMNPDYTVTYTLAPGVPPQIGKQRLELLIAEIKKYVSAQKQPLPPAEAVWAGFWKARAMQVAINRERKANK